MVRYIGRGRTGKFGALGVADEVTAKGNSEYHGVIDFYAPRSFAKYDKSGYKRFVASAKDILFGNPSRRMNREACETFFNNDYNFKLRNTIPKS